MRLSIITNKTYIPAPPHPRTRVYVLFSTKYKDKPQYIHTMLKVMRYETDIALPCKGRDGDAGWDLASAESVIIPPGEWKLVDTGVGVTVPMGTYGRVAPRSGVSTKGILVNAGVIDRTYTGRVKVLLVNISTTTPFVITKGDRIAQLILERIEENAELVEVAQLDDSVRGAAGFGSSG